MAATDTDSTAPALEPYLRLGLQTLPRCLGQLDRRATSKTFGCADVGHWRYSTHDVSNARLQELVWLLALAYTHKLPGGERYHGNPNLRGWILGAGFFWAAQQAGDGSVPEVYPHERSFCATAFSTWAMSEMWILLGLDAHVDAVTRPLRSAIVRSARWLATHDKPAIANQMAAAAVALSNVHGLEPEGGFNRAAEAKLQHLLGSQGPNGSFPEYGGCDYGYQSVTLSTLTHLLARGDAPGLRAAAERGGALLEQTVDDRGLYDYSRTSRQTQFLYPAGLVRLGLPCVERHLRGVERDEVITPLWMDDRYCIALATDYVLAYLAGQKDDAACG